jgi:hypothetical protein
MSRFLFVSLFLTILCIFSPSYVFAQTDESSTPALSTEEEGLVIARAAILSSVAITTWGLTNWDWGSNELKLASEGWLTNASKTGGSDKTGHMFFTYTLADLMNWEFKRNGMKKERAARASALTSLGVMTLLEVGDSTSGYGFSYEDLIMDSLVAGVSYLLNTNPSLEEKLDFRIEYWPSKGLTDRDDYAADYSGMKHLFAIKGSGFDSLTERSENLGGLPPCWIV